MSDPNEAVDWQGCAVSCKTCPEREIPGLKCKLLPVCTIVTPKEWIAFSLESTDRQGLSATRLL